MDILEEMYRDFISIDEYLLKMDINSALKIVHENILKLKNLTNRSQPICQDQKES